MTAINLLAVFPLLLLLLASSRADSDGLRFLFTWGAQGQFRPASQDGVSGPSPELLRWSHLQEKGRDSATLLADIGNTFFPGALSRFSYGKLMNEVLNQAGVDVKRVSVHDFLLGRSVVEDLRNQSRAVFLATNIIDAASGEPAFEPVYRAKVRTPAKERDIEMYALVSPSDFRGPNQMKVEGLAIQDPLKALRVRLSESTGGKSCLRICLLETSVLEQYPGVLETKEIDYFITGAPGAHSGASAVERTVLKGSTQILHIPPFPAGVGDLTLTDLESGNGRRGAAFSISTMDTSGIHPSDKVDLSRMESVVAKWSLLYRKENQEMIRGMATPLKKGQIEVVANLLREKTGSEIACLERNLVADVEIPTQIRSEDLNRLLNASPDLLLLKLSGRDVRKMAASQDVVCIGYDKGEVEGRSLRDEDLYSLAITETAWEALGPGRMGIARADAYPIHGYRNTFIPILEAVKTQLQTRPRNDYGFAHLNKRWRLSGTPSLELSRRDVFVMNPDSVKSLPGVVYAPFEAWNMALAFPLRLYNRRHGLDLAPEVEYAEANGKVGRNSLGLRLGYNYGTTGLLRPYASSAYQSYLTLKEGETRPARLRTSAGALVSFPDWRIRTGLATEKSVLSRDPNPFAPLRSIFARDTVPYGKGVEFVVEGSQNLAHLFQKFGWSKPNSSGRTRMLLDLSWDNYFGTFEETAKFESRLRIDLTTEIIPPVRLRLGFRAFYAYIMHGQADVYNLEPSLTLMGVYRFKTGP